MKEELKAVSLDIFLGCLVITLCDVTVCAICSIDDLFCRSLFHWYYSIQIESLSLRHEPDQPSKMYQFL